MRSIFTIVSLIVGLGLTGQSSILESTIEYLKTDRFLVTELKEILDIEESGISTYYSSKNNKIYGSYYVEREIDFGHKQIMIGVNMGDGSGPIDICVQYYKETPYITLIQQRYPDGKELLYRIDSKLFSEFIQKYNDEYEADIGAEQIQIDYLIPFQYGYLCGIGGEPSNHMYRLMEAVNQNDILLLKRWLESFNYNLRVFGATGLLWLEKRGRKLKTKEEALIEKIRKDNYPINYCEGCSPWVRKTREILMKKSIKRYYKLMKSIGFIR